MFRLVDPHPAWQRSFLAAADEFAAEGRPTFAGIPEHPAEPGYPGIRFTREGLEDRAEFERYVEHLLAERLEDFPRPLGYVPFTVLWLLDEDTFVGRISVRHELTSLLLTWGGHIGYGIRPSFRRLGAATYALDAVKPVCVALGIDPALITCDVDNTASRRTIERNGGVYEDTREGKLRFWMPTSRRLADLPG